MNRSIQRLAKPTLVAFIALAGCAGGGNDGGPTSLAVRLAYVPTEGISPPSMAIPPRAPVYIAPVEDARDQREIIGENREDADERAPIPILAEGNPAEFIREAAVRELGTLGFSIASDPGAAERTVTLRLTRFFTAEGGLYVGDVWAHAQVFSGDDVLWQGLVSGRAKRFGRSLKAENYREVFSDATQDMIEQLAAAPGFQTALVEAR